MVNLGRQADDFGGFAEFLARGQDAGQEQRGVDGRELATPLALSGDRVEEVIKLAVYLGGALGEELESGSHALRSLFRLDPAAFHSDGDGGQAEAGRGDAGG